MAITHKNIAIMKLKEAAQSEAFDIVAAGKSACAIVPRAVIFGGARLAVTWRCAAEKMYYEETVPPLSLSLSKMRDRVRELKKLVMIIINPAD